MLVTVYFWWSNIKGIHESSGKALRIMQITTVMVVAFLIWCPHYAAAGAARSACRPRRCPQICTSAPDALGWFQGTIWPQIGVIAIIIAFGHSLLSMSGFETLAQVYREIAYPKLKNLRYTGNLVCIYAVVCTGVITLFAGMIIPDDKRGAVCRQPAGRPRHAPGGPARCCACCFHIFVVIVGVLILSGAVNTSIIGANGVMNRVAEDGVLLDWFRKPQQRFGTTYRIINLIALLQIAHHLPEPRRRLPARRSLRLRRGLELLPEIAGRAGAALPPARSGIQGARSISRIGGREIPVGLALTTLMLFLVAIANLFSKQIATIYGVGFTIVLVHHLHHLRAHQRAASAPDKKHGLEEFNLDMQPEITAETVHARPGCVLVAVRDYHRMAHLQTVLEKTNLRRHDIVVMTVRPVSTGAGEYELSDQQLFSDYEKELLSSRGHDGGEGRQDRRPAGGAGRRSVRRHGADRRQAEGLAPGDGRFRRRWIPKNWRAASAWPGKSCPSRAIPSRSKSSRPDRPSVYVNLGPHPPRLWPEDLDRAHDLWLQLAGELRLHACITATWSAWPCAACRRTWKASAATRRWKTSTTNCANPKTRPSCRDFR